MAGRPFISIVVPLFNEQQNVASIWQAIVEIQRSAEWTAELVFVDDGSTDNTWSEICALSASGDGALSLRGVRFSRNFGKESAILAGLRTAQGDAVVTMDGDLQHPPELVPTMIKHWQDSGCLIVEAMKSRRQPEGMAYRLAVRVFYLVFDFLCGIDLSHATDYKLLDRKAVDQYLAFPETGKFFRGLTAWMGVASIAIEFEPDARRHGKKSWSIGKLFDLARSSIIRFSSIPLRLVTWLGGIGILASIIIGIQTLWYHWMGLSEEGFPSVIILILGMGSLTLFGIGLIGEYVAEIYAEIKRRPAYFVADTVASDTDSKARSG
jgi:glycosyltransferase involved in cell wall biosynthesis